MTCLMEYSHQYDEAAKIDSASGLARCRRITWPLLAPTTYLILILQDINSFQVFSSVYVMTGGGPLRSTEVVVYYLYQRAFESLEFGYASAISLLMFLFRLLLTVVQRVFKRRP